DHRVVRIADDAHRVLAALYLRDLLEHELAEHEDAFVRRGQTLVLAVRDRALRLPHDDVLSEWLAPRHPKVEARHGVHRVRGLLERLEVLDGDLRLFDLAAVLARTEVHGPLHRVGVVDRGPQPDRAAGA